MNRHLPIKTTLIFMSVLVLAIATVAASDAEVLSDMQWSQLRDRSADLSRKGDYAEAHRYAEAGVQAAIREYGPNHPETAVALKNLAASFTVKRRPNDALPLIEEAYRITSETVGSDHIYHVLNAGQMGETLRIKGDLDSSEIYFQEAIGLFEAQDPKFDLFRATTYNNYALLLANKEKYHTAVGYLERALKIKESILPGDSPEVIQLKRNLQRMKEIRDKQR